MIIRLFWPECNFINNQWVQEKVDSFWVECTQEEAERKVFPYLTVQELKKCKDRWKENETRINEDYPERAGAYFLVSTDLNSIMSFPWYYPISGHWNGYCPFQEIGKMEIKELKEISRILL